MSGRRGMWEVGLIGRFTYSGLHLALLGAMRRVALRRFVSQDRRAQ